MRTVTSVTGSFPHTLEGELAAFVSQIKLNGEKIPERNDGTRRLRELLSRSCLSALMRNLKACLNTFESIYYLFTARCESRSDDWFSCGSQAQVM